MVLEKNHENSLSAIIAKKFERAFSQANKEVIRAPLDGSDRIYRADTMYADPKNLNFLLIEDKYGEKDIITEHKKNKKVNLCEVLVNSTVESIVNKLYHDKGHFIAWSEKHDNKRYVLIKNYFDKVCISENIIDYYLIEEFIEKFMNKEYGLNYNDFKRYIDWLYMILEGKKDGSSVLEMLFYDEFTGTGEIMEFNSLQDLKNWIDSNFPNNDIDNDINDPEPDEPNNAPTMSFGL